MRQMLLVILMKIYTKNKGYEVFYAFHFFLVLFVSHTCFAIYVQFLIIINDMYVPLMLLLLFTLQKLQRYFYIMNLECLIC